MNRILFTAVLVVSALAPVRAQERTMGLMLNDSAAFVGYTLFAPLSYDVTYLINNEGLLVHSWESAFTPGNSAYLLENGNLLRTADVGNSRFRAGGTGGRVEEFDWDGNPVWEFDYSSAMFCQHHDIEQLLGGNILMVAWEYKSRPEAIAAGRDPARIREDALWPDHVIEVDPATDSIVWEWHLWDHLVQDFDPTKANYGVVADHPELVDINFITGNPGGNADWIHTNSVDYNEEFDQVILSTHELSEIWVIDHSTTTEEARGHTGGRYGKGGDLLYRWGNPQAYRRGTPADRQLFKQHDAQWIPDSLSGAGNILIFNNGPDRPGGNYTTIDEIVPPVDDSGRYTIGPDSTYGPEAPTWSYQAPNPPDFYASHISGCQRMPNGNTLICDGPHGVFFEVAPDTEVVWRYINPVTDSGPMEQGESIPDGRNRVFRAYRYAPEYAGFAGRILTPGDPVERYPPAVAEAVVMPVAGPTSLQAGPNPFGSATTISFRLSRETRVRLAVFDALGRRVELLVAGTLAAGDHQRQWQARNLAAGTYFCTLTRDAPTVTTRLLLLH